MVGVGAGLGEQPPSGSNNGFSWSVPTSISRGGGEVIDYVRRILCSTLQYDLQHRDVTYE